MKKVLLFCAFLFISFCSIGQNEDSSLVVEKSAEFPGGMAKFYQYLSKSINFPKSARKAKVDGKVYVEFVINVDGSVDSSSVRALAANEKLPTGMTVPHDALDNKDCQAEAIRVIKNLPKWIPGTQNEKPVRLLMIVPIIFKY